MGSARLHFVCYLLISFIFSAFLQPILIHWAWHNEGWMHKNVFSGHAVSVKDHAGGIAIHLPASCIGLMSVLFLGRRLLRLRDIDESSVGSASPASTITGYILIAVGLIAFSLPTTQFEQTHAPDNYIGIILVNYMMAMAAGIIIVVVLHFVLYRDTFNYWIILKCTQGALAGIIAIASGVDAYTPIVAFTLAIAAGVLFYFVAHGIHVTCIEDYCNIIAIHFVCGLLGALAPPLLGSKENLGISVGFHTMIIHFQWQSICAAVVIGAILVISLFLFSVLSVTGFLRNTTEKLNHKRGVVAFNKQSVSCCLTRLFALHSHTAYIEPGRNGKNSNKLRHFTNSNSSEKSNNGTQKFKKKNCAKAEDASDNTDNRNNLEEEECSATKKPRFVYTIANVHDVLYCNNTTRAGGDCQKVKQNTSTIDPVEQLANNLIYVEQDAVKNNISLPKMKKMCKLRKTRKYTNLHKRKTFMLRRINSKSSACDSDSNMIIQSEDCMLYDAQYNDGFVTLKMPTDLDDNSDVCTNEFE